MWDCTEYDFWWAGQAGESETFRAVKQPIGRKRAAGAEVALRGLPERQRSAVVLQQFQQLGYREIGLWLEVTPTTVQASGRSIQKFRACWATQAESGCAVAEEIQALRLPIDKMGGILIADSCTINGGTLLRS